MASVVALTGILLTGKTTWGPITPAVGTLTVQLVIDRVNLALLTQPIAWSQELSVDGGTTWTPWGGTTCAAGTVTDINLVVQTESSFSVNLPAPADANTRLRGSITTLEPMTTSLTLRMT